MEPIGSIQGLATGIDFRELVDAIIEAESRPALLLVERKTELDRETTAWGDVELRIRSALDQSKALADPEFFKTFTSQISGPDSDFSVSAGTSAAAGSFSVEVLQLATRERVGSDVFLDRTAGLGLAGEFVVGGRAVQVLAGDSLEDVAQGINATATGVSASVVGTETSGYRIVLTAAASGSAGIQLADRSAGLLRTLGFVDGNTSIKHQTSDGAKSDGFQSSTAHVGTLLGLSGAPGAAAVTIGPLSVTIDLASDSLADIAAAINVAAAAPGPPNSIAAEVVTETDETGATVKRLDISGTTSYVDTDGILETLGVLEASRGAVAQQIRGAAFTDGDAFTPATGSTRLRDLWVNGGDADLVDGDTITVTGTHGDGTTFTKILVLDGGDRYSDLIDELNSATDGFGVGGRTATASIVDGAIVVTDDAGGSSQLALSIVTHNEGGGSLDFGEFELETVGRDREITAGQDAELLVDGTLYSRRSNSVSDVVTGVTLSLSDISENGPVTVDVSQDVDAIVSGIEAFVKSFNSVSEFVLSQFTGIGAEDGESARPLSGDRVVRQVRDRMRAVLQTAVSSPGSTFGSLVELGIEANRDGTYDVDTAQLRAAMESDPLGVERFFSAYGAGSVSSLDYVSAGNAVEAGSHEVFVTTPASRATVTGLGFGGTYVDDATPDTMIVTDTTTGSTYEIALGNGATLSEIVSDLNAEFGSPTSRHLQASEVLYSDPVGTLAAESTLLQDIHNQAGFNLGIANGDTFTLSGTQPDGTSFFQEWTVTDVASQTLAVLRAEIAAAIGADVVLDVSSGVLTATAVDEGTSSFSLAVSSDNAGGGAFSLGPFGVTEEGRHAASITASDVGGELTLTHDDYGSNAGFSIGYLAGGADGSASLGVAASAYSGIDVAGTIGGFLATGQGRLLTGDDGSVVEGLVIRYTGATTGTIGSMTFSRGIASLMEAVTDGYLDGSDSSIQGIVERLDTQKRGIDERIESFEDRLVIREESLIRRFTALEEAMALATQQLAWLQSQLGTLSSSPLN